MIVENIKYPDKKKAVIDTDNGYRFPLYKGEIRRYNILEGEEISQENISEINQILVKRCRERALYILERNDKTEHELRVKLKSSFYPEDIVDSTIEFLKKYDYIDDYRYAANYIRIKKNSKSIQQMKYEMATKGIPKAVISDVFQNQEINSREVIEKILISRNFDFQSHTKEQCSKQIRYLLGKGFLYEEIISVIKEY